MSHLEYSSLLLIGIYNKLNNKLKSTNFFWTEYTVIVKVCVKSIANTSMKLSESVLCKPLWVLTMYTG